MRWLMTVAFVCAKSALDMASAPDGDQSGRFAPEAEGSGIPHVKAAALPALRKGAG